jgi:hypothetical protein
MFEDLNLPSSQGVGGWRLWSLQQLREAIPADHEYRCLIHDWHSIFSGQLDESVHHLWPGVLKTAETSGDP